MKLTHVILRYFFLIMILLKSSYIQGQVTNDSSLLVSIENIGCIDIDRVDIKLKDSTYSFKKIKMSNTSATQLMPYLWTNNEITVWIDPVKPLFYSNKIGLQSSFIKIPIDYIGESKLTHGKYTVTLEVCKMKRRYSKRQRRWKLKQDIKISAVDNIC